MKSLLTSFTVLLAASFLTGIANAQYALNTGTPTNFSSPAILSSAQSLGAEFSIATTENIIDLSAYLTHGVGQPGETFNFDLFTSLPTRSSTSPIHVAAATYEADGWNSVAVNWTLSAGTYFLALKGTSPGLDAPTEASSTTGPVPAIEFAYAGTSGSFSTSGAPDIGLEILEAPEPSSWMLVLVSVAFLAGLHRRAIRA